MRRLTPIIVLLMLCTTMACTQNDSGTSLNVELPSASPLEADNGTTGKASMASKSEDSIALETTNQKEPLPVDNSSKTGTAVENSVQQNLSTAKTISPSQSASATSNPVYIPKAAFPVPPSDLDGDVLGVIVYNGNVYHQIASRTTSNQYADFEALKGDFVGTTIDLRQYADEFPGKPLPPIEEFYRENKLVANWRYDVYTVKGYDSAFRLMVPFHERPMFFECLNDMGVAIGSDLLAKMKVQGNVRLAEYDIKSSNGEYGVLGVPTSNLEKFVTALYGAPCFDLTPEERGTLYEKPSVYLYLVLNDGTIVPLRLYEGGVVSCSSFPAFFRMELDIFNLAFQAIPLK